MRVLLTGAAGSIGTVVLSGLLDRGHQVVGLDRSAATEGFDGPWHTVDCTDPDAVDAVVGTEAHVGLDAVVHLAGKPDEGSLPEELTSHVVSTAALLDAMVRHGVSRIVYASSNHAVGRTPRADGALGVDLLPRPDTHYGVAKVAAEALLRLSADRHGIDALVTRIGSFLTQPETVRQLATWLSHDDAVRMFEACLTSPDPGFAVLWGISANQRAWWDLEPGRALGYHPQDDAEDFAAQVDAGPDDDAESSVVGGPFAGRQYHRPAL